MREGTTAGERDIVESEPLRHGPQLAGELRSGVRGCARLGEGTLHHQDAGLAIALPVDARNERVTEEKRQDVVAVDTLGQRDIDLDAIAEPEQSLGALALPD